MNNLHCNFWLHSLLLSCYSRARCSPTQTKIAQTNGRHTLKREATLLTLPSTAQKVALSPPPKTHSTAKGSGVFIENFSSSTIGSVGSVAAQRRRHTQIQSKGAATTTQQHHSFLTKIIVVTPRPTNTPQTHKQVPLRKVCPPYASSRALADCSLSSSSCNLLLVHVQQSLSS